MRDFSNKQGLFIDSVSVGVNLLDTFLGFLMDLFAHCDGEVSDLMRNKATNLFSPSFRSAMKGKVGEGSSSAGLLGGETAVRTCLIDTTKEDELLSKTMQKSKNKRRSQSRSRRRSRSRSRTRSRSPRRGRNSSSGSGSGKQAGKSRPKAKGGNNNSSNNNNNNKDDKEKKEDSAKNSNKCKDPAFSSPLSFMEAWDSSFFTTPALLLLTTLLLVQSHLWIICLKAVG